MLRAYVRNIAFRLFPDEVRCLVCHALDNPAALRCAISAGFTSCGRVTDEGVAGELLALERHVRTRRIAAGASAPPGGERNGAYALAPLCMPLPDAAVRTYVAAFAGPPWNEAWSIRDARERLLSILSRPESLGLMLRGPNGEAVAALGLGLYERWHDGVRFTIRELCVHPALTGRGLGTRILADLTRAAFDVGASRIYLQTARGSAAEALYRRAGFVEADEVVLELGVPGPAATPH